MQYFPIFVDGKQLNVLVVGGGEIATRKVELMLKTPANVTVISPKLSPALQRLAQDNKINYLNGCYDKSLLEHKQLVFVATANGELNQQISVDARAVGVMANVVDSPELCHFITPSIIDRSPMVFAISSEGQSPVLVRYWREKLETLLPQSMGAIARFAGNKRWQIKQLLDNVTKRRNFWESFFSSNRAQQVDKLDGLFDELIEKADNDLAIKGELYVVEAPSDPDLLTLAALRNMQKADIAVFDNKVSPAIIELIRRDADREALSEQPVKQISQLLAQGLRVCYLSSREVSGQSKLWQQLKEQDCHVEFYGGGKVIELV